MEPSLPVTLLLAFGLGLLHALDADHIVAVSALASRRPGLREALVFCARWAIGHAVAVLVLGGVVLLIGAALPPQIGDAAERMVGVVLILLGLWVLWDLRRRRVHAHVHLHEGLPRHAHWHAHGEGERHHAEATHQHDHSAVLVGLLHGTAGSAPVIALVPLAKIASPALGIVYLLLFSLGVLVSMTLFGGLIGVFFDRITRFGPRLLAGARAAVGLGAIAFGIALL